MHPKTVSWLARLRQHHALEHATIHLLTQRYWDIRVVGRSDFGGFTLLGDVSTTDIVSVVNEALTRLQRGESGLAIHPRCGTNLAASALLAGLSSFVAMGGKTHSRWEKLPRVILATMGALLVAQPLGLWAQEHITTSASLQGVRIKDVIRQQRGRIVSHRIILEHV